MNQVYLDSARLLTRVAPLVLVDDTFALKGGTAINLFVRDMPRLSVDLDLVFPDHTLPREQALRRINEAIRQSAARLQKQGFLTHAPAATESGETKLMVRRGGIEVKIEVNFVMRGTVHPVHMASLTEAARDTLQADLEIPVASFEDVYGGKLVAAMDRQHPRDLFDVTQLFLHEGITAGIRRAFVVYLASHNRPVHEVLFPSLRDLRQEFEHNFAGMTTEPVELDALLAARERMMRELQQGRTAMSAASCCRWLPQSPNGRYWACRTWSSFPACDGSCKTWNGFGRPTPENSPSNRMRWPGYLDERRWAVATGRR